MIKFLQNVSFYGGLMITVLGVVTILIANDTGQEPKLLMLIMTWMVFGFGLTVFLMLYLRSKVNKK